MACCVLSESLPQFDFGEFPHHALDTNTPTSKNPMVVEAKTKKLSTQVPVGNVTEMCGSAIMHGV
jgi:hypothetical protein